MKFCQLGACFKTNYMFSVYTEKNFVFFKDCFKSYHVCFECFLYILRVSNLLKKEFTKQVFKNNDIQQNTRQHI